MRILCAISVKNSRFLQIQMYVNITIILVSTATGKSEAAHARSSNEFVLFDQSLNNSRQVNSIGTKN